MIRRFHFDLIARLAKKLESVPEGDGTMLDNTVIVYVSDGAEGHHSRCWEWPMVVLGNAGGKLKTGRYVDYPGYGQLGASHESTPGSGAGPQTSGPGAGGRGPPVKPYDRR